MKTKYLNEQSILKDYKFGKLNLKESIRLLKNHKVSKKISLSKLMNVNRKNIVKIKDYLVQKKSHTPVKSHYDDEEYFFEIELSPETENNNEAIFEINYDEIED